MRDEKWDITKAIAIYLVVLGHLLALFGVTSNIINFSHMPIFFFISGYFLNHSLTKYNFFEVIKKKAKTLLIPYLAWSFISFLANVVLMIAQNTVELNKILKEFLDIFLYARSTWFFIILFFSSVFLTIFVYCIKSKFWKLGCIFAWILVSFLPIDELFLFYKFKWLFPFMLLGYSVAQSKTIMQKKFPYPGLICIACVLGFILSVHFLYNDRFFIAYSQFAYHNVEEILMGIIYYIISVIGILSCILLSQILLNFTVGRKMKYIGQASADIYVMHMLLIKFLTFSVSLHGITLYIFSALYSFVIVVICLFIKYLLKNVKLYNFSMGKF